MQLSWGSVAKSTWQGNEKLRASTGWQCALLFSSSYLNFLMWCLICLRHCNTYCLKNVHSRHHFWTVIYCCVQSSIIFQVCSFHCSLFFVTQLNITTGLIRRGGATQNECIMELTASASAYQLHLSMVNHFQSIYRMKSTPRFLVELESSKRLLSLFFYFISARPLFHKLTKFLLDY